MDWEGDLRHLQELIYEAGLDDELFSVLPERLAEKFDARSCSLLWTDVTPNYHPVLIRASALLLPMWVGEARGCVA